MGQRSQIYIRLRDCEDGNTKEKHDELIARYFQWNYGERMVSRAASTLGWLKKHFDYLKYEKEKIPRIVEVNFDMRDIVFSADILKEYAEELVQGFYDEGVNANEVIFKAQDNNDGKLLIDIQRDGTLKYAFLDDECKAEDAADVMSPTEYLDWDEKNWRTYLDDYELAYAKANIATISEIAEKMTVEEVHEFLSCDYSISINAAKEAVYEN